MKNKIYILHDFNGKPYYKALEKNTNIVYLNTRPFRFLIRDIIKYKTIQDETIESLKFFLKLPFHKDKVIMIAMAPFNYRMIIYSLLFKKNTMYYHTSWPYWINKNIPFSYGNIINKLLKYLWKYYLLKFDKIIAVTKASKKELEIFISHKNIKQIYHTVDIKTIDDKLMTNKNKNKIINICFIGRLTEEKGIYNILRLIEEYSQNPNVKFHIIGDGILKDKFDKNNFSNLSFYGYVSSRTEVRNILEKSDIFILPSLRTKIWEELFGIVVIEAMSQGNVVISTNHIGPTEIITHNENGFLFTESEYDKKIILIINKVIEDKNFIYKHAISAINKSRQFSIKKISNDWSDVLEN
jgi:glycosyltransferase involved in cell wall biosynthesis